MLGVPTDRVKQAGGGPADRVCRPVLGSPAERATSDGQHIVEVA
ncbi:MAG: hypothetical protein ACRDZX_14460 [Acidimicrobiales bacterium]